MSKDSGDAKKSTKSKRVDRGRGEPADWGSVDAELLKRAVERAATAGGAIRLGYSRDGGAYAIGVYGDGDPYTEYVRPSEDIDDFLKKLAELFDDLT